MSINAHELSNRLLNALDNNYNVSFRLLMIVSWETSWDTNTVHEPMAPDSMLRFSYLGGCPRSRPWRDVTEELCRNRSAIKASVECGFRSGNVVSESRASKLGGVLTSSARFSVPRALSVVPKILQCENMELCHAWPLVSIIVPRIWARMFFLCSTTLGEYDYCSVVWCGSDHMWLQPASWSSLYFCLCVLYLNLLCGGNVRYSWWQASSDCIPTLDYNVSSVLLLWWANYISAACLFNILSSGFVIKMIIWMLRSWLHYSICCQTWFLRNTISVEDRAPCC